MENGRCACAWTAGGCSSLPLAHLFDGAQCWENAEGHSMSVLLPVVANDIIVAHWRAGWPSFLDRALPFTSLTLGNTVEGALPLFSYNREQASLGFLLSSLSHGFELKFLREIENPLWVCMRGWRSTIFPFSPSNAWYYFEWGSESLVCAFGICIWWH